MDALEYQPFGLSVAIDGDTLAVGTLDATLARGPSQKRQSPNGFGYALALAPSALIVGASFEGQPIAATPHGTSDSFE